ncbi:hypothetical protein [Streptomyces sp. NPDC050263]|uniref:hypothetical protein n=1 Tax=Streptomyces sp. NPDC050263 TaxID=3155037 RepID=UPI00341A20A7
MFDLLLIVGFSAFALPLAIATLRGWAPHRIRRRTARWVIRVRGVALLVLWTSAVVVPLSRLLGADPEDSAFLTFPAQFGLMMFAAGLMCGAQLGERFSRQATPAR